MLSSMTAFSRTATRFGTGQIIWEIRSVNHRYLDVNLRFPEELRTLEMSARERFNSFLHRGRIDASLKMEYNVSADAPPVIDRDALRAVARLYEEVGAHYPGFRKAGLTDLLRWPGVLPDPHAQSGECSPACLEALDRALEELVAVRQREGARIRDIIGEKIDQCLSLTGRISAEMPSIQQRTREKWQNRIRDIAPDIEPERLSGDIALMLTKSDTAEEIDRLNVHLDESASLLASPGPVGRRLDFLMQELNREANTLGAKSVDRLITNASIDLKVLVDQMREQTQNIE